jgi:rRNA maturation RNase YbeY
MPSPPPIYFHFLVPLNSLKERSRLKQFLFRLLRSSGKRLKRLDYIFCDDDYLLKINQKHLNHDYYTDIITFNLAKEGSPIEGEIYISVARVRENAHKYKSIFSLEVHRVIFHGVLHLAGIADHSLKEKEQMRKKEENCLAAYFS